jgi:hypothetical protein
MNRNNTLYDASQPIIPMSGSILGSSMKNNKIQDSNITYMQKSSVHENYWFQDLSNSLFNLDFALRIFPNQNMTYPEKINSMVRLSIYIGLILALFYANYLFLYIPIIVMIMTYLVYIFRINELESERQKAGPNAKLNSLSSSQLNNLTKRNMSGMGGMSGMSGMGGKADSFENMLNIKRCSKPSELNPFMNPLVFDSRKRDASCDPVKPENQFQIENEYNKYCIKDVSDIFNHNSGRRQFYTVASTTYPNNQAAFANWLYKTPPTCKEGNGAQCAANYYTPLNMSLLTPGYGSSV